MAGALTSGAVAAAFGAELEAAGAGVGARAEAQAIRKSPKTNATRASHIIQRPATLQTTRLFLEWERF